MRKNKGITLVALVITIIVLLILAGVSISMVVGENGVLNRATNASEKTSDADVETALKVAVSGLQGDFIGIWNEDNKLKFMDCVVDTEEELNADKKGKILLKIDGYKLELGDVTTVDSIREMKGKIQKVNTSNAGIGSVYTFTLKEKSRYGADVQDFTRVTTDYDATKLKADPVPGA